MRSAGALCLLLLAPLAGCQMLVPLPDRMADDADFAALGAADDARGGGVEVEAGAEGTPQLVVVNERDEPVEVLLDGGSLGSVGANSAETFDLSAGFHAVEARAAERDLAPSAALDHFTVEAGYRYVLRVP